MKKSNKGITMIEIVVVIIILILLAVIAIWNTWSSYVKAEGVNLLSEFQSIEKGAVMLQTFYNLDENFELQEDQHYCQSIVDASGDTWYVLYGRDEDGENWYANNGREIYEKILENWGLDNLNRSYEVKLDNKIEIRYANHQFVELNKFKIFSYDDIKTLHESGVF